MFDAIVVGARCAGSAVAMLLARQGHRVLVVDRATFPSDTVSTHYVQQSGLAKLRDWGLYERLVETGCTPVKHLTFSYTDILVTGFADPVQGIDVVYCPRRTVLDQLLVDAAREAGAEVREGFTVDELIWDEGRVVGIRGRQGTKSFEERAPIVIGADGSGSTVAKLTGAEVYRSIPAGCFVYYSYYSGLDWQGHHRTGFGEQQIGAWPTNDGLTLLAVMRKRDRYDEFRSDVEKNFLSIYREIVPDLADELESNGRREERFYPNRYPDNYYRTSHGPGWALVGDAGYHKDPFTGQGICDAFKHAELLAERVHQGLAAERDMDEALAEYVHIRDEETRGTFELTCSIAELRLTPRVDARFRAATQDPEDTKRFFAMIAGGYRSEDFFDAETWSEMRQSLPG